MSETTSHVVLIGASKSDARECKALLEGSKQLTVRPIGLRVAVEDYADLAVAAEVGAVIIGRIKARRTESGYSSLLVADFLRSLREQLPIFYLADDSDTAAASRAAAIDAVFFLDDLRREPEAYVSRLLRAMGRYGQALTAQQQRLRTLLDRQNGEVLGGAVDASELQELEALRRTIERPIETKIAKHVERQQAALIEQQSLVAQLEAMSERLEKASRTKR